MSIQALNIVKTVFSKFALLFLGVPFELSWTSFRSKHWRCSVKQMFLEISQNSYENTCVRVSFLIKLQNETLAQLFSCEFCEIFKNIFLRRTPVVAASEALVIGVWRMLMVHKIIRLICRICSKLIIKTLERRQLRSFILLEHFQFISIAFVIDVESNKCMLFHDPTYFLKQPYAGLDKSVS